MSSDKVIPIDVRVICATNKNLAREVRERRFRMDLFFQINVLKLEIPPLRERREDIPLLVEHFLEEFCKKERFAEVSSRMRGLYPGMQQYAWPGNIRELQAATERIAILLDQGFPMEIDASMMMEDFGPAAEVKEGPDTEARGSSIPALRREDIVRALRENNYRKGDTAVALGISRSTLWRLKRKYEIE